MLATLTWTADAADGPSVDASSFTRTDLDLADRLREDVRATVRMVARMDRAFAARTMPQQYMGDERQTIPASCR